MRTIAIKSDGRGGYAVTYLENNVEVKTEEYGALHMAVRAMSNWIYFGKIRA